MLFARHFLWPPSRWAITLFLLGCCLWWTTRTAVAETITAQRISQLASEYQPAWNQYLCVSDSWRERIEIAFLQEVQQNKVDRPRLAQEGADFRIPDKKPPAWYASKEATAIAESLLSFQNPAGGWSKHISLSDGQRGVGVHWSSQGTIKRPRYVGTFDNGSTTSQILFLAQAYRSTNKEQYKGSVERGLRYILDAQYPNGGWPQVYPLEGGYHDDITYNDDAMVHVLQLLSRVKNPKDVFEFVPESLRQEASHALDRGIDCILKTQQHQGSKRTVWCAQHDALTLKPSDARAMEPASLSGLESVGILKLLMEIREPSKDVVEAIESGLMWFSESTIQGIRRAGKEDAVEFVQDSQSKDLYWARFYDLQSNTPIFPGRNGIIYSDYWQMAKENRLGYDYLTTRPSGLLGRWQKSWKNKLDNTR